MNKETREIALKMPSQTRLAWIGTGVMGAPMCGHLLQKGYPVSVFNRTRAKAQSLIEQGAVWSCSPAEAVRHADLVFSMVGFPSDVREVYFGADGIFAALRPGTICVDMTTTEPGLAREIAAAAKAKGARAVDAPVSGGDVGARNATLSIMAGGDREAVETVKPFFEIIGKSIIYEGEAGSGQHTKMCNQIVIAGTMIGVCESLLYAHRAGLNPQTMLRSIEGGAAACWTLSNLAPRVLRQDFEPGFIVEHFIKDMEIVLREAAGMNLALPGLALVHQLYVALRAQGHGKKGTQALFLALQQLSASG